MPWPSTLLRRPPRVVESRGRRFTVAPGVFDPARHLSGLAFAARLPTLVPDGSTVLEIGTGCGVLAAAAAERAAHVVATDLDARACACAEANLTGLPVEIREGDLFDPVRGERFDLLVANPPYLVEAGDPTLASPDFLRRFGAEALTFAEQVVIGFPADDIDLLAEASGLDVRVVAQIPTAGRDLAVLRANR